MFAQKINDKKIAHTKFAIPWRGRETKTSDGEVEKLFRINLKKVKKRMYLAKVESAVRVTSREDCSDRMVCVCCVGARCVCVCQVSRRGKREKIVLLYCLSIQQCVRARAMCVCVCVEQQSGK